MRHQEIEQSKSLNISAASVLAPDADATPLLQPDPDAAVNGEAMTELIALLEQHSLLALDRLEAMAPQLKRRLGSAAY